MRAVSAATETSLELAAGATIGLVLEDATALSFITVTPASPSGTTSISPESFSPRAAYSFFSSMPKSFSI